MNATGSRDLKIWLADGTNYPGQGDIRGPPGLAGREPRRDLRPDRRGPAAGARVQVLRAGVLPHRRARTGARRTPTCSALGERAMVCLDTGHHAPGHQHRVHRRPAAAAREARLVRLQQPLLRRRRPDRRRGRPVPAVPDPGRGASAAAASAPDSDVACMLDQCHNIEKKIPGQIRSVLNVQEMTARALLRRHRRAGAGPARPATCCSPTRSSWTRSTPTYDATSPPGARSAGLPADPMRAYLASGYQEQIEADRVGGAAGRMELT